MRFTFKILIALLLLAVTVSATLNSPSSWGRGYKLYNPISGLGSYWDLMGEQGIQNGSLANLTNISMKSPDATNATATITFSTGTVHFNSTLNASNEYYSFINGSEQELGSRLININVSQNMSYSCSQFVTEVNLNSTNLTASTCSSNVTILTSKFAGTGSNSYTTHTNESNITRTNFTGGTNYTASYVDAPGTSYSTADSQDVIYRTTDTAGDLREIFRVKVNTSEGGGFVLSEIAIPTSRPSTPVNGSAVLNQTSHTIDVYDSGNWYNTTGTVV